MLTLMNDLPANSVGVSAEGKVTGKDYETVLIPAVEEKLKTNKKVNFIYHIGGSFNGLDVSAMVDDAKIGMKHIMRWDKVALVSDNKRIDSLAEFFGHVMPCEVRVFKDAELDVAKKWIAEA